MIRTHAELSEIRAGRVGGPYSRLRPGTVLGAGGKIDGFVETGSAQIGAGSKLPHLAYCGDAYEVRGSTSARARSSPTTTVTTVPPTHLGDHVFIGSNSVLVAPLDIGDGAFVAAGSAVVDDVPAGALAVARGREHISEGWVAKRRQGSLAEQAANGSEKQVHPQVAEARARLLAEAEENAQ